MKEKNAYTYSLCVLGIVSLLFSIFSLLQSEKIWVLLGVTVLISLISLFPIRLPNQFFYSFDLITTSYMLLKYDWKFAILPASICLITINLLTGRNILFRYCVNLGLYTVTIAAGLALLTIFPLPKEHIVTIAVLYAITDIISYLANKSIHISILGFSVMVRPSKSETLHILMFILIGSLVLYRLVQAKTAQDMIMEILLTGMLLYLIYFISNKYFQQIRFSEESTSVFERCFDATNQILVTLHTDGTLSAANSVSQQIMKAPFERTSDQTLWDLFPSCSETIRISFHNALSGATIKVHLPLMKQVGTSNTLQATLVPFTRDKKIVGIYLIGQLDSCGTGG